MGSFGEKFREERERRGFTLDDISNVTKIGSRMLQAIEQEHFDVLPGGVFNKGFVRAYAKLLGFNDQEAVAGYLTALRQAQLDAQSAAWDQPPAPRTPTASIASAAVKQQVAESPKPGNSSSFSSSADWPLPEPLVRVPISAQSGSTSVAPENGAGGASSETIARESQGPPVVVAAPLWVSPPLSSSAPAKSLPSPPPLVPTPPITAVPASPAPVADSSTSEHALESEAASHVEPSSPPILADEPPRHRRNEISRAPSVVAMQKSSNTKWKAPLAILGLGVIIVAALLWGRHSRAVSPAVTTTITANASPSATPVNSSPPPSPATTAKSTPKATGNNPVAERAASSGGSIAHAPPHSADKKPQAPAPFRVAIRASENCWVSITADGELVARENLIAPATTSVKASRELVVQVSNPASVSFRWNDRTISAESDSGTKTFVFDSNGLRSNP